MYPMTASNVKINATSAAYGDLSLVCIVVLLCGYIVVLLLCNSGVPFSYRDAADEGSHQ